MINLGMVKYCLTKKFTRPSIRTGGEILFNDGPAIKAARVRHGGGKLGGDLVGGFVPQSGRPDSRGTVVVQLPGMIFMDITMVSSPP